MAERSRCCPASWADPCAGRHRNPDHKVGRRRRNLERRLHGLIHRQDLHRARPNPQQARSTCTTTKRDSKAQRYPAHMIALESVFARECAVHSQPRCNAVRWLLLRIASSLREATSKPNKAARAETTAITEAWRYSASPAPANAPIVVAIPEPAARILGSPSSTYAAAAPLEVAITDTARGPDRIFEIDMENQREQRHDHHASAKARQRAEESRQQGTHSNQGGQLDGAQLTSLGCGLRNS